jgi:hypothetical protein
MSERDEDIATSAEIIKAWLVEEQGSYLALENQVVHWNNDTDKVFQSTWVNLNLKDCVRIVRATRFPLGLMKYCTEDAFVSSAQELDRVYERAVSVNGACPAHYFNYKVSTVNDPLLVIVVKLLEYTERNRWNILWRDLAKMLELAWTELDIVHPNRNNRNNLIREACRHTKYGAKQYAKGYNYRGKKYACVKLDYIIGFDKDFDEEAMHMLAMIAIKGSHLKRKQGIIVSEADISKTDDIDVSRFTR